MTRVALDVLAFAGGQGMFPKMKPPVIFTRFSDPALTVRMGSAGELALLKARILNGDTVQ